MQSPLKFPMNFLSVIPNPYLKMVDFPDGPVVKNPHADSGDMSSIPGSGRSPGVGNGNPLQCSCLENSIDRRAWQATVQAVAKSQT